MCYSAQIWADYRRYKRAYGSEIDIATFAELFWSRLENPRIVIPRGVGAAFEHPTSETERAIWDAIEQHRTRTSATIEQDIFKQRKRLVDAERSLLTRHTKKATEDVRIAGDKIARGLSRLEDLRCAEHTPTDSRIYPGNYAPVMVMENGRRIVKPMRYQCRPAGRPAVYDTKYPGTYNARRDNLTGFWRGQFGVTHGLMVVDVFYENVSTPRGNVVLEFRPRSGEPMLIACLWSKWSGPGGPDLLSFAAITSDPPPEVAAAGHDRCIVHIRPENMDRWLRAAPGHLSRYCWRSSCAGVGP
jgi:putative SOS response-associated peptidase YedK